MTPKTAPEYFRLVIARAQKIEDPQARHLVYMGALYLELAANQPGTEIRRRITDIQQVWLKIKPLIQTSGIVREESKDPILRGAMQMFLQLEISSAKKRST